MIRDYILETEKEQYQKWYNLKTVKKVVTTLVVTTGNNNCSNLRFEKPMLILKMIKL